MKMNKKGEGALGPILRFAVPAFIILVIFFGGLPAIIKIFSFTNKIPAPVWIVFGIIVLFMILRRKK